MAMSKTIRTLEVELNKKIFYHNWFVIDTFLCGLRKMSRGDQYREINNVVREYRDNWHIVELHNSNKSINNFVTVCHKYGVQDIKELTRMNAQKRKMKFGNFAQMFEQVTEMCTGLRRISNFANFTLDGTSPAEVREGITSVKNDIQEAANKISNLTDVFQENFAYFSEFVKEKVSNVALMLPEVGDWIFSFLIIVAKLFSLGYLIMQPCNQNITNVTALVTLALPATVAGNQQLIAGLIRAIKGVNVTQAQTQEEDSSFVRAFFDVGKNLFTGMFTNVDKASVDSMILSSKKIKLISDYIKNSSTILEMIMKLFEKVMCLIGDKTLKLYGYMPTCLKEEKFTQLVDEYVSLKQNNAENLSKKSHVAAVRVRRLYDKLLKYEADLNKKMSMNRLTYSKITPYLRMMVNSVEKIINEIPEHLMEDRDINRKKPYWLYIHGEPRIGKSAMFQPYMINVLARALGYAQEYENYVNYTYFLNCADEYREGYWGQWCTNINDWLQNYKDEQMVQKCIADMTNMIDDNLYALNMAFASKGKVYFNSPLVVSNAQKDIVGQTFLADKCWSNGAHLYARRNLVVEVKLNPAYRHPSGAGINNVYRKQRLNENIPCVGRLFPNEMYKLRFTDPLTGRFITELDFKEGVKHIVDDAKRYFDTQDEFKQQLFEHFRTDVWDTYAPEAQTLESEIFVDADNELLACLGCRDKYLLSQMHEHELVCPSYHFVPKCANMEQIIKRIIHYLPEEHDNPIFQKLLNKSTDQLVRYVNIKYSNITNVHEAIGVLIIITDYAFNESISFGKYKIGTIDLLKCYVKEAFASFVKSCKSISYTPIIMGLLFFLTVIGIVMSITALYNKGCTYDAQTVEGSNKQKIIKRVRQIQAQEYSEQNLVVETKIKNQSCKVAIVINDGDNVVEEIVYGTIVGVGSDVFICPKHYYNRWKLMQEECQKQDKRLTLKLMWSDNNTKHQLYPFVDVIVYSPQYNHTIDTVYLCFNKLIQLSNLSKFFCNINDQPNLYECYLYGMRGHDFNMHTVNVNKTGIMSTIVYSHASRYDSVLNCEFPASDIELPISYKYFNAKVVAGDCGMMLLHCDNSTNCKKIIGMHIAGNVKHSVGYSCPVFSEDITEAIEYFKTKRHHIELDAQCLDEVSNACNDLLQDSGLIIEGCKYYMDGKKFKTTLPRKNKVQESICHDIMNIDLGASINKPSALKPFVNIEGNVISPFANGIKKMARTSNAICKSKIDVVCEHMYNSMLSWESNYKDFRVLDLHETLNGFGLLKKLDLNTSAGFPYILDISNKGKVDLFDVVDGKIIARELVKTQLEDRIVKAKNGIIKETYFMDTLKDEVRPISKVEQGATRVFQVSPVDLNLALRQYFGAFVSFCHSVALTGEMAVGINANSYEWTLLIKELLINSENFINGDGKNFDASIGQQYMMYVVEIINKLYNDGEDNANVRRVLFSTFMNSYHIQGNTVYRGYQGNKSGIALTTIFNNLAGMFAIRYAYLKHQGCMDLFHKRVRAKFYGDDDLISVKKFVNKYGVQFDSLYYKEVWAELGVDYTSAHKMKELMPYSCLNEITFLQRSFCYDKENNVYLPCLKRDTILEIPRWSESDPQNMVDQMARFNSALIEISNYGLQDFQLLYDLFKKYINILSEYGYVISVLDLFTYMRCKQIIFPHLYL